MKYEDIEARVREWIDEINFLYDTKLAAREIDDVELLNIYIVEAFQPALFNIRHQKDQMCRFMYKPRGAKSVWEIEKLRIDTPERLEQYLQERLEYFQERFVYQS